LNSRSAAVDEHLDLVELKLDLATFAGAEFTAAGPN